MQRKFRSRYTFTVFEPISRKSDGFQKELFHTDSRLSEARIYRRLDI